MHWLFSITALAATVAALPTTEGNFPCHEAMTGAPVRAISVEEEVKAGLEARDTLSERALSFQNSILLHHNLHRVNHSAPNVTWGPYIAGYAQTLAERCVFQHNVTIGGGGYGQNIAAGLPSTNITGVITDLWYGSEFNYYLPSYYGHEPNENTFDEYGHFTQVVWKATATVGCYVQDCSSTGLKGVASNVEPYLTVCNYKGPGNYLGEFATNVLKPLGKAQAKWNTGL